MPEGPRTASVLALDKVECLGLDRWVFLTQLESQPQLGISRSPVTCIAGSKINTSI